MKLLTKFIFLTLIACATQAIASTVKPASKTTYGSWDSLAPISVQKGTPVVVFGWAADTAASPTPTTGVSAKIFVDGALLVEVPATESRSDVTEYYGFKDSGFTVNIDTSKLSLGAHTVEVRVGGGPSGWNKYPKPAIGRNTFMVAAPVVKPATEPAK